MNRSNKKIILIVACEERRGFELVSALSGVAPIASVATVQEAVATAGKQAVGVVVTELDEDLKVLTALRCAPETGLRVPIVMVAKPAQLSLAARAGRLGAVDIFERSEEGMRQLSDRISELMQKTGHVLPLILRGNSEAIRQTNSRLSALASVSVPLLIQIEKGDDRYEIVQHVHETSEHWAGPLSRISASKGSRASRHPDHGTIFLDGVEGLIGEAARYWRELIKRLENMGSASPLRIVGATADSIPSLVENRSLDRELARQFSRYQVSVPMLADRGGDIEFLMRDLLKPARIRLGLSELSLSPKARELLGRYPWTSMASELRAVADSLAPLADGPTVSEEALKKVLAEFGTPLERIAERRARKEREQLLSLYEEHGTYSGVARELGITRNAVKYRFAKHNLLVAQSREKSIGASSAIG